MIMANIITVDGEKFESRQQALDEFEDAILGTDGSEQSRMVYAYMALKAGCTFIDTRKEIAR